MKAFFDAINPWMKYAYIIVILGILIVIVLILKNLLNGFKPLVKSKDNLSNITSNLEKAGKKAEYIAKVNEKTFFPELFVIGAIFKDFKKDYRANRSVVNSSVRSLRKHVNKSTFSKLPAKIKAVR